MRKGKRKRPIKRNGLLVVGGGIIGTRVE